MAGEKMFTDDERKYMLGFVRQVIAARLFGQPAPELDPLSGRLDEIGSCFVTLHTVDGALRGCIGNIAAFEPLGLNLEHNASNAAFNDPRFPALAPEEIDDIEIEISVLTPMEEIASPDEFIVGEHGIVLRLFGRSAVFLPQVAPEQGWDRETTLAHLCMKAGLAPEAWRMKEARFEVFKAIVFSEKEFI